MTDAVKEQETGGERQHSTEEKFFGVQTPVTRPSKAKKAEEEERAGSQTVEIDRDERDEKPESAASEAEQYSKNVQKRIDELTYKAREAERQRDALKAERDEAFRATQVLHSRTQEYERIIASGEEELVRRVKQSAEAMVNAAKDKYRKAYEEGDTDQILEAQESLIKAQSEMSSATAYEQEFAQRKAYYEQAASQSQYQPQPQQPQQPRVPEPDKETKDWAAKNPWFMDPKHRDMSAVALATHETLVTDEGIKPNTPEYFQRIDETMRRRFPDYFEANERPSAPPASRSPVAPATRTSGAPSRKVRLTETQLALAKKLGLTPDQYAAELIKTQGASR